MNLSEQLVVACHERFRGLRAAARLTGKFLAMTDTATFTKTCIVFGLGGYSVPLIALPSDIEAAKIDTWCMLLPRQGYLSVLDTPINMRADDGTVVGEVALLEARGRDLWGLIVFMRADEDPAAFAARVRLARIMQQPNQGVVIGDASMPEAS